MVLRSWSAAAVAFLLVVQAPTVLGGCASGGEAEAAPTGPVGARGGLSVERDLKGWTERVTFLGDAAPDKATGYTECAPITEVDGGHVCASSSPGFMNLALMRASLFAEGNFGGKRGAVAATSDMPYRRGLAEAGGHDLRSEHLEGFWRGAERACAEQGASYCATREERALFEGYILPLLGAGRPFVLIAFPSRAGGSVVSHEILHAQYFLERPYRDATDRFWDERVTAPDKSAVKDALAWAYDVSDDVLVRNEFMAYVLEPGARAGQLGAFVETYRLPLSDALRRAGTPPISVSME